MKLTPKSYTPRAYSRSLIVSHMQLLLLMPGCFGP